MVALQARNAADTGNVTTFRADPDGAAEMWWNGSLAFETQANGVRSYGNNVVNQGEWEMWDATALIAAWVSNGTNTVIYSNQNSEIINLRGKTSGGTNSIGFQFDPDVGVAFNGSSAFAAPTYSVSNVTTDRTYNANSTTLAEVADVLGTLIADLRSYGLVV